MTTISIALATYNGERFLLEQLDSLVRQTRLPDELVVADDGSTDRTPEIVGNFSKVAPFRVTMLPNEGRLGYRANFMRCAAHCSGDLIAFCDQDDVWDTDKVAVVLRSIHPDALLLQHDFRVADTSLRPLPGNMETIGISAAGPWAPVLGLVQVFRRALLNTWPFWTRSIDHNHPSERMAHDQWVYFAAHALDRVQLLRQPLLTYRQHVNNTYGFSGHRASTQDLRPQTIMLDFVRGQSASRIAKRNVIAKSLTGFVPASERRSAIIEALCDAPAWSDNLDLLRRHLKLYERLKLYYEHRLQSYRPQSRMRLLASLAQSNRQYLLNGSRGLKDFIMDAALNL